MRVKLMTHSEIQTELAWSDEMIAILLGEPDSPYARRNKVTGAYSYGLYRRERVMAVSQTPEAIAAKKRWDGTIRGWEPA
jgi:hypothetical protein